MGKDSSFLSLSPPPPCSYWKLVLLESKRGFLLFLFRPVALANVIQDPSPILSSSGITSSRINHVHFFFFSKILLHTHRTGSHHVQACVFNCPWVSPFAKAFTVTKAPAKLCPSTPFHSVNFIWRPLSPLISPSCESGAQVSCLCQAAPYIQRESIGPHISYIMLYPAQCQISFPLTKITGPKI